MRAALLLALVGFACCASAVDPLALTIRPQLPANVITVADAAAYYLEPSGYEFYPRTPVGGDARRIVFRPVREIPAGAAPLSIESALLAIAPADAYLIVDHERRAVAFSCARCRDDRAEMPASRVDVASLFERARRDPIHSNESTIDSEPVVASEHNNEKRLDSVAPEGSNSPDIAAAPQHAVNQSPHAPAPTDKKGAGASTLRASTAPAMALRREDPPTAVEIETTRVGAQSFAAIEPAAALFGPAEPAVRPAPTYTYELVAGETLEQVLTRWGKREHLNVIYRAGFQLPVIQNTTVPAQSLSEAVTYVLGLLAGTPHALVAEEAPNQALVIKTP